MSNVGVTGGNITAHGMECPRDVTAARAATDARAEKISSIR